METSAKSGKNVKARLYRHRQVSKHHRHIWLAPVGVCSATHSYKPPVLNHVD